MNNLLRKIKLRKNHGWGHGHVSDEVHLHHLPRLLRHLAKPHRQLHLLVNLHLLAHSQPLTSLHLLQDQLLVKLHRRQLLLPHQWRLLIKKRRLILKFSDVHYFSFISEELQNNRRTYVGRTCNP